MPVYSHESLLVNGRHVRIEDIVKERAETHSEFERDTYVFIRQWLSEQNNFHFQTSGSTGTPKNIVFRREQMIQSAKATIRAINLLPADVSLVCLNTKYVAGKMMIVRSFINNMQLIIEEPASNPLEKIKPDLRIDFAAFVPMQIQTILNTTHPDRLNNIKTIILGGAPVNSSLRKQIQKLHTKVLFTYGMTETLTHIALEDIQKDSGIYKTLPGIKIDKDERNCLTIDAPFLEERVITNDMVQIESTDSFRWLGRLDNVINSGGLKIHPEKVEEKLNDVFQRLNTQRRFFLAGLTDEMLGARVTLFIEGAKDSVLKEKLEQEMTSELLRFEIPRQIVFIRQFAVTPTGKINRPETIRIGAQNEF